jgi:hypothetical protein
MELERISGPGGGYGPGGG